MAKYKKAKVAQLRLKKIPDGHSIDRYTYNLTVRSPETKHQFKSGKRPFDKNKTTIQVEVAFDSAEVIVDIQFDGRYRKTVYLEHFDKDNPKMSLISLKSTSGSNSTDEKNKVEVKVTENAEVAWYLIKKQEPVGSWVSRVLNKPLLPSDWEILSANNPHLPNLNLMGVLQPGQVVILSNSKTAKELPKYKKYAQHAYDVLEEMNKMKDFDAEFFAQNYEFLYDSLKVKSSQIIPREAFDKNEHPLTIKFNEQKKEKGFFEQKMAADATLLLVQGKVHKTYMLHAELANRYAQSGIKGSSNASLKFSNFRLENASLYNQLNQEQVKNFLRWDQSIKTSNMRKILNQSTPVKDSKYQGGVQEYAKELAGVGKASIQLKSLGYLSIALDVINSGVTVYDATPENRVKTTVVETAKVTTGIVAGSFAGALIVGLATGGTGLIVLGIVAITAPMAAKAASEIVGWGVEKVYDFVEKNEITNE